MTFLSLTSETSTVWCGEPFVNVDFVLRFPSDVGLVKNANAHLVLLSNKRPTRQNNGRLGMVLGAGKQIRMPIHNIEGDDADDTCSPVLVFQNPIFGTLSERNVDELLCSHLNFNDNGGDEIHLSTRIHLRNLSTQISGFALHLDLGAVVNKKIPVIQGSTFNNKAFQFKPTVCCLQAQSNVINIAKLKLCIQNLTSSVAKGLNKHQDDNDTIEWYCKHGGDNTSIDVRIHLKDAKGRIVSDHPSKIPIKTELVYEDGSSITFPSTASSSKNAVVAYDQIYRAMRHGTLLKPGEGSCHFGFRIEDVSKNHKPHRGFRLKVCPSLFSDKSYIVGGIMEEMIVVKSRPTYNLGKRNGSVGGRSTIIQRAIGGIPAILSDGHHKVKMEVTTIKKGNPRMPHIGKVGVLAHKPAKTFNIDKTSGSILFDRSNESLPLFFTGIGNTCLGCSERIVAGQGLSPAHHKLDCRLFMSLGPILGECSRGLSAKKE